MNEQNTMQYTEFIHLCNTYSLYPHICVVFDNNLSFNKHIDAIVNLYIIIFVIFVELDIYFLLLLLIALANALVSSRLDYCNSLLFGISKLNILRLQRLQNCLARAITKTSKFEHITPVLTNLHWLPVKQRNDFKIALIVHKVLHTYNSVSY